MTLREVLHAHVPTLTPDSTVRDAVDKLDIYQFPGLILLNTDLFPIAVVTEGDICRAAQQHDSLAALRDEPVIQFATPDPTTASPSMEISDALHLMFSQGITILPIVDMGVFCGLVLRVDLMHAMFLDARPVQTG
ncbi:MAG: CBS domain-containing protein [Chthonomonadaceae bacterium]|nr:CBS domain-containing protein [Chthonomonadaceae bacterium]